jgi:hypothetical protein
VIVSRQLDVAKAEPVTGDVCLLFPVSVFTKICIVVDM